MTVSLLTLWLGPDVSDHEDAPPSHPLEDRHASRNDLSRAVVDADRDAGWVERIRAGDRDAFVALYQEYLPTMIGFAHRMVGTSSVAEDIAADVFTAIWQRRLTWIPAHGARAYLFRAVRMRALDVLRHARVAERAHSAAADQQESPGVAAMASASPEQMETEAIIQAVDDAIAAMPELRRRVLELRWHHALQIPEIAEVLGLSRAAVDQHLTRGVRTLRRTLPEVLGG